MLLEFTPARKYVTSAFMDLQDCLAYRANALMWGMVDGLPALTMAIIWLTVYGDKKSIGGYTLSQMVTYYLVALSVSMLTTPHVEHDLGSDIRYGRLSAQLVKPFDRWITRIVGETVWQFVKFSLFLPTLLLTSFLVKDHIELHGAMSRLLPFATSLALAYTINVSIKMMLASLSFWLAETSGIGMILECFWGFLSGEILPLSLLPAWAVTIAAWLPFKWVVWFPVELLMGRLEANAVLGGLLTQGVWAVGALVISRFVWLRGLRAYSAVGG